MFTNQDLNGELESCKTQGAQVCFSYMCVSARGYMLVFFLCMCVCISVCVCDLIYFVHAYLHWYVCAYVYVLCMCCVCVCVSVHVWSDYPGSECQCGYCGYMLRVYADFLVLVCVCVNLVFIKESRL